MKKAIPLYAILLSIASLFLSNGFAEDHIQQHFPEGAKMRIGKGAASDITFTPDGTQFAVTTSIGIWIYDAKTGAEITVLKQPGRGYGKVAFSPDGNVLACATRNSERGEVQLWDTAADKLVTTLRASPLYFFLRMVRNSPVQEPLDVFMYGR